MRLENELGIIGISNDAIATIASNITRSCFGVKSMTARSGLDGLVHLLRREIQTNGVKVRTGEEGDLHLDLHIAVNYGVNIPVICRSIVSEVQYNMHRLAGVNVSSVNLFIDAIRA